MPMGPIFSDLTTKKYFNVLDKFLASLHHSDKRKLDKFRSIKSQLGKVIVATVVIGFILGQVRLVLNFSNIIGVRS